MNKLLVTIIVWFSFTDISEGQTAISLHQGFNYSFISDSRISDPHYSGGDYKPKISNALEMSYLKKHDRKINYRISLSYISRNFNMVSSIEEHFYTRIIDADFKLRYLSLAFLPEIEFGKKARFSFNLGPSLDFLASGTQNGSNFGDELTSVTETSFISKRTDYSASQTFRSLLIGVKSELILHIPVSNMLVLQFKSNFNIVFNNIAKGEIAHYTVTHCGNLALLAGISYQIRR